MSYQIIVGCEVVGKEAWPELLGTRGNEAVEIIKRENSMVVDVQTVPPGALVTQEINCHRVRVWVDDNDTVVIVPQIG